MFTKQQRVQLVHVIPMAHYVAPKVQLAAPAVHMELASAVVVIPVVFVVQALQVGLLFRARLLIARTIVVHNALAPAVVAFYLQPQLQPHLSGVEMEFVVEVLEKHVQVAKLIAEYVPRHQDHTVEMVVVTMVKQTVFALQTAQVLAHQILLPAPSHFHHHQ